MATKLVAEIIVAEDGHRHLPGDVFSVLEDSRAAALIAAGAARALDAATDEPDVDPTIDERADEELDAGDTLVEWPVKNMTPEKYLEKYPSGPKADIARAVIAQSNTEE